MTRVRREARAPRAERRRGDAIEACARAGSPPPSNTAVGVGDAPGPARVRRARTAPRLERRRARRAARRAPACPADSALRARRTAVEGPTARSPAATPSSAVLGGRSSGHHSSPPGTATVSSELAQLRFSGNGTPRPCAPLQGRPIRSSSPCRDDGACTPARHGRWRTRGPTCGRIRP